MKLSNETKMLVFEIGCLIMRLRPDRRYIRESDLSRVYSQESWRCRELLPNGTIVVHDLIRGGMSGDEIGLSEQGLQVFEGLFAEFSQRRPEWFLEHQTIHQDQIFTG